ncbi:hypothetical protein [Paractinoplanes toevensis]|uniref:Uncharacterized protein n=1 Tax=Paractinoplanes toevensis TaxID=571911 RepID=A0A919T521_9ACTN|nr:hypothetical protein [Actinoplanes toevensis]GIM88792.1 hypothetical protein Ato02nite_005850 [Actinoplanes toevensis]
MNLPEILDVVEDLLRRAEHPDITAITRYGDSNQPWGPSAERSKVKGVTGLKVAHQSTATAMLWGADLPGETPLDVPATLPEPKYRAARLAILVVQLLDAARPAQFKAWRLVALPDMGPTEQRGTFPSGVSIVTADGTRMLLCTSSTGAMVGDEPAEEPFPDWQVPALA